MSALQQRADSFAPVTVTSPLGSVAPSAQSLLNTSASSLAAMLALEIVTLVALMTFQPSRSPAVAMRRWSEVMLLQWLVRIAKCPPRLNWTLLRVRPSQLVSDRILSASPVPGLPVMRLPAPSMVPDPVKAMPVSPSP